MTYRLSDEENRALSAVAIESRATTLATIITALSKPCECDGPCRVGITSRALDERIDEHKADYPDLKCETVLVAGIASQAAAQAIEDALAGAWGCNAHGGGDDPDTATSWLVYFFCEEGCAG